MATAPRRSSRPSSSAGFEADVVTWVAKVGERLTLVPRIAAYQVQEDVRVPVKQGGHMPVKFGNLRNSLSASFNEMPGQDIVITEQRLVLGDPQANLVATINSMSIGQRLRMGFRVTYAADMERKYAFVALTAQKWKQFVDLAVTLAKQRLP